MHFPQVYGDLMMGLGFRVWGLRFREQRFKQSTDGHQRPDLKKCDVVAEQVGLSSPYNPPRISNLFRPLDTHNPLQITVMSQLPKDFPF